MWSATAHADFFNHFWDDQHTAAKSFRFEPRLFGATSSANFDATGARFTPTDLNRYTRTQLDLTVAYGLNPFVTLYARASLAAIFVQTALNTSAYTIGFPDQTVGLTLRAGESRPFSLISGIGPRGLALDFQLQVDIPAYNNAIQTAAGQPAFGDQTLDTTGGLFLTMPWVQSRNTRLFFRTGVGFTYRTANFASAIPWTAQFSLDPVTSGFMARLSADGVVSLNSDPRAATQLAPTGSTGASGSYFVNAANPTLLAVRGSTGFKFNSIWSLEAEAGLHVWGLNAPAAYWGGAVAKFSFGGTDRPKTPAQHELPVDYGRSNQGFVAYEGDAKVTRVNDKINSVRIDRGTQQGVEVGQLFDIFKPGTENAPGSAVARTQVIDTQGTESTLRVEEYYQEIWIENGMIARRPLE